MLAASPSLKHIDIKSVSCELSSAEVNVYNVDPKAVFSATDNVVGTLFRTGFEFISEKQNW